MKVTIKQKFLMLATAAVITVPMAVALAETTNIDATAEFQTALTLANEVDMDFGVVEFSAAPAGGDTASLGTDGTVAYAGNFSGAGTGIAGEVEITTGTVGATVEIFCEATGTLTRTGGGSINVVGIEVAFTAGAFNSGTDCTGLGTAATTRVLAGGGADVILLGGQLDGATATAFVGGTYSTANAGGDNIQVDVFYQ